ncbi:MAG: biotin--[acetyl-CoA-carboxylase] ligase [Bacilli bacterium]
MNYHVVTFDSLPSTNQYIKDHYMTLPHKSVIVATHQTSGRGRFHRSWIDVAGTNLLCSILLKETCFTYPVEQCSLVGALSVAKTIDKYCDNDIKWPNDILIHHRKVAGILLEAVSTSSLEAVIVGIGINVNQSQFAPELSHKATSLAQVITHPIDPMQLLDELLVHFDEQYERLQRGTFSLSDYEKRLKTLNQLVTYQGKTYRARAIDDSGALVLEGDEGMRTISSGEVEYLNLYETDF